MQFQVHRKILTLIDYNDRIPKNFLIQHSDFSGQLTNNRDYSITYQTGSAGIPAISYKFTRTADITFPAENSPECFGLIFADVIDSKQLFPFTANMSVLLSIKRGFKLLGRGQVKSFITEIIRRFWTREYTLVLRRDLRVPYQAPAAKIDVHIRKLRQEDIDAFFNNGNSRQVPAGYLNYLERLLNSGIRYSFVATDQEDNPAFLQWLIPAENNPLLRKEFGQYFPELEPHEVLLDGGLMHQDYRGNGIMADALSRITEMGRDYGATHAITLVETYNTASLKGCHRAGFRPYKLREVKWRFFRESISFQPVPRWASEDYYRAVS